MKRLIIPRIYIENLNDARDDVVSRSLKAAVAAADSGADALYLEGRPSVDAEEDAYISALRRIANTVDVPVYAYVCPKKLEDVKKVLYAGCEKAVYAIREFSSEGLAKEVLDRFGGERLIAYPECLSSSFAFNEELTEAFPLCMCGDDTAQGLIFSASKKIYLTEKAELVSELIGQSAAYGVCGAFLSNGFDISSMKYELKEGGAEVDVFESPISFSDFKVNEAGLIPCIVADAVNGEVLMMAWMNEESFNLTLKTGKMTYYSRSRRSLWVKGETSGHFQYVKALSLDCDNDTLLARVRQIGAACHTGSRSCFFKELVKDRTMHKDPAQILNEVMAIIEDRKVHPKEGSYTNYLFDKGIDKMLKKVGEECAEVIIAAKNPDREEIIYEISDLLYHLCVLMSQKGVTWEEITRELSRR